MTTTHVGRGDDVRVRKAVQADLLSVLRIERASFEQPWPFSAFERYLDKPGFLVATTESDGTDDALQFDGDEGHRAGESVIGYVIADLVPNHGRSFGHVKNLAVHPDHRGTGVGSKLLERALAVLRRQGAQSVKLEVRASNAPAVSLYQDFGFEYLRTIPRYYDDDEDALILVLDLDV